MADIVKRVLMFVRAHMQTLKELVPYFFALDYPNYAQWMSAHIHDLQSQPESVLQEFSNVNWVISKKRKEHHQLLLTKLMEQNNRSIKATGRLKALTGQKSYCSRFDKNQDGV